MTTPTLTEALAAITEAAKYMQERSNALATGHGAYPLIEHFVNVRNTYDMLSAAKKAIDEIEGQLSRELIPEALKRDGVKNITIIGIGRVGVSHRYSCSMPDKPAGIAWLKSNGHEGIVQETVNSQTLASFAKALLIDHGKELPPELFKVGTSPFTSITKA